MDVLDHALSQSGVYILLMRPKGNMAHRHHRSIHVLYRHRRHRCTFPSDIWCLLAGIIRVYHLFLIFAQFGASRITFKDPGPMCDRTRRHLQS